MTNPRVVVSLAAIEMLNDEPSHLSKIYQYLCRYMDTATSITGVARRISYKAIQELLEVPSTAGRKAVPVSRHEVRSCLRRLVDIGLIVDMSNCVFLLPKERPHKSVSERLTQGWREPDAAKYPDFIDNLGGRLTQGCTEVDAHLINQSINQSLPAKFQMTNDWMVSAGFEDIAKTLMFDVSANGKDRQLFKTALIDLRMYWQAERPDEMRNQVGWERALLTTMKRLSDMGKQNQNKPLYGPSGGFGNGGAKSPASKFTKKLPWDDKDLPAWAASVGARAPKAGESYAEFRKYLKTYQDREMNAKPEVTGQ